ncbi:MAG: hypothetical protein C4527_16085 [Candidatus Omnitrophota bacterium]|jgi:hypothetical protein|nr:MAG: hypothetical protein C4527_16085 [Candidatus Omnitrophota bacterium]
MKKQKYGIVFLALGLCLIAGPAFAQYGIFDKTADWSGRGSFKAPGKVEVTGTGASAEYRMFGNGDDIWDAQDEGFFVYTEKSGSWSLQGKVQWWDQGGGNDWCKIGVMIREQGDVPNSRHYWIELRGATFGDRTDAQWRTTTGGSSGNVEIRTPDNLAVSDPGDGLWLRVTRFASGGLVMSEYSLDGTTWNYAHSQQMTFPETVAYGLAITNHLDNELLAEATVTDVKLTQAPPLAIVTRSIAAFGFKGGETVDVTLSVNNPGTAPINAIVKDTVPQGWTASAASNGGTVSGRDVNWTLAAAPGITIVTYKVKAPATFDGYIAAWSGSASGIPIQGVGSLAKIGPGVGIFEGTAELVPYQHATRGLTHAEGWAEYNDARKEYEVGGNGWDMQEGEDEGFFLFNTIAGSFRVEATVAYGAPQPHDWSKIGLMVRASLDPGSPRMFIIYRGIQDIVESGERLTQNGGFAGPNNAIPAAMQRNPVRLAITRFAATNTFVTEYFNEVAKQWVTHYTQTINMPPNVVWGLAASSHVDDTASWAVGLFTDIVVKTIPFGIARTFSPPSAAPGGSLTVTVTANIEAGVASNIVVSEKYPTGLGTVSNIRASVGTATDDGNGTISWNAAGATGTQTLTYTYSVKADATGTAVFPAGTAGNGADYTATIPQVDMLLMNFINPNLGIFNGWMDIGTDPGGSVGRSGDNWAVVGKGHDIWDTADDFTFLYKRVEGDFVLRIDNVSVGPTGTNPSGNDWQKMGLMARQSLAANSQYVYAMIRRSDQAFALQWRDTTGGSANWGGDSTLTYIADHGGRGMILERDGPLFITSYIDASGNVIEQNYHELDLTDPIYIGVAVTSHQTGATSVGFFSNPQFTGTAVPVRRWELY